MKKEIFQLLLIAIIINEISLFNLQKTPKIFLEGDEKEEFVPKATFNEDNLIIDKKKIVFKETITSEDIIKEMGLGWNLGNTLDAWNGLKQDIDSETCWGNPKTTKEMIEELYRKGFRTIRLPTTWRNHLIDENYTIDPAWMKRVKEIVDWCIEAGLYVILNVHHDNADLVEGSSIPYGNGYYPLLKDLEQKDFYLMYGNK